MSDTPIGAKEYASWCNACLLASNMRVCCACHLRGSWTKEISNANQKQVNVSTKSHIVGLEEHPVPVGVQYPGTDAPLPEDRLQSTSGKDEA